MTLNEPAPTLPKVGAGRICAVNQERFDAPPKGNVAMTRQELKTLRHTLGASLTDMATAFNVDRSTYIRWESGKSSFSGPAVVLANLIKKRVVAPAMIGLK